MPDAMLDTEGYKGKLADARPAVCERCLFVWTERELEWKIFLYF